MKLWPEHHQWRRAIRSLCLVVLAAGLCYAHSRFRLIVVSGNSMRPSLYSGDFLLLSKMAYLESAPVRGDVVVARNRGDLVVKRVIGLPGEKVEVVDGHLRINDEPMPERHVIEPGPLTIKPGRLLSGKFALLGDNRALGLYQTVHPIVTQDQILGKVVWTFPSKRSWQALP